MAENVKTIPEEIREDSILRMIEHWQMEYQPESTVDPSSNGVPTGKAVANYVKGYVNTQGIGKHYKVISTNDQAGSDGGTIIEIPEECVIKGENLRYVDVVFKASTYAEYLSLSNYGELLDDNITCEFESQIFRFNLTDILAADQFVLGRMSNGYSRPFGSRYARMSTLEFTYHNHGGSKYTKIWRTACAFTSEGKYQLYLSRMFRDTIGSDIEISANPTAEQHRDLLINLAIFYY